MQVNLKARAAAAERKRNSTRSRLIEAAMRVVADKGPEAVSVSDVAAAAGLSRGVFYNYFPTPEDLVVAVRNQLTDDLDQEIIASIVGIEDPAERIARACHRFITLGSRPDAVWGWVRLRLDGSPQRPPPVVEERFLDLYAQGVRLGRFTSTHPMAAMSLCVGTVNMAMRLALLSGQAPPDLAERTVSLILAGLGVPAADIEDMIARLPRASSSS